MTFYVNAWLDRVDPFISLHNRQTGEQVARFDKHELQQCLEQGDFCLNELCNPSQQVQHELVKCLLLVRCSHEVSQQLESIYHSFFPRPSSADIIPFRSKPTAVQAQRDCA
ncbi:MAG: hypothetical protein L3K52_09190 [Candidatus Thiothrix sulfatifontis]|uniref:hypothetical protein n=1 Tax=Thiothrix subterranea TaxID=2735563 RepID=UPI00192CCE98|nr:hypothetical protein [Thiothrix subterranea]QQZ27865.1 hypothetical protein HMY34_03350 [Thiothrix subterranea]UOG93878.1 MAG: hypothetical protein L3K52_09190 [Candidatus Thiothrix sulfatifontis]